MSFRVIDVSRKVSLKKRRTSVVSEHNATETVEGRLSSLETRVKEILPLLGVREIEFINIKAVGSHTIELYHNFNGRVSWYVSDCVPGHVDWMAKQPEISRMVNGLTFADLSDANVLRLELSYVGTLSITVRSVQ
jgi:hypothetical protein